MRYPILPVLFVIFVAAPAAHAQGLEDFSGFHERSAKKYRSLIGAD